MSYLQLGVSALSAIGLLAMAAFLGIGGAVELYTSGLESAEAIRDFLMAFSLGLVGVLCLPSAWFSYKRLSSKDPKGFLANQDSSPANNLVQPEPELAKETFRVSMHKEPFRLVTLLLVIGLPLSLGLGQLASTSKTVAWLLLPPLNLVATGLPVLWLAMLGMRKLDGGSLQQRWGLFVAGAAVGPVFSLLVEFAVLALGGVLALVYVSTQPELMSEIQDLAAQIRGMTAPDQEALMELLAPYLKNPAVITGLLLVVAVSAPLVEELFKPIGLWLLAWKKLTPAQGLVAGIISGAGFALFENLGNTSGAGELWALVALSRIPAAMLHMTTSGLMGWAMVTAWSSGRYWKLALSYAAAVTIHGLWNGLAVLSATSLPGDLSASAVQEMAAKGVALVAALVLLGISIFFLYLRLNRSQRPKPEAPAAQAIIE